jgi:predicted phage terminase large subunit-like protein
MIKCRDGHTWEVINLPAEAERPDDPLGRVPGQMLWPEWFDAQHWAPFRLQSRTWSALFQQRPRPDEGGIFKEAWCRHNRYGVLPAAASTIVHSWDTAQKPGDLNDPSALTVWGRGPKLPGHYLREVWAKQVDYPTLKRAVLNFADRDRPSAILIEDKSSGQSLIQDLRNDTSLPVIPIEPLGDKIFRANEVSAMVEAGLLHLPEQAPWLVDFEGEFFGFPLSTNDDRVDSVTQYLKWVREAGAPLESAGAGLVRAFAAEAMRGTGDDFDGYGGVARSDEHSMEGF